MTGRGFLDTIEDRSPLYVLLLGNTESAKIPGISAAGASPELTDYTPAADAEFLLHGECRCIDGVPVTPDGIPTPAVISRAALSLLDAPVLLADAGLGPEPEAPVLNLGGSPGGDVREPKPVPDARGLFDRGAALGRELSRSDTYLVVAESIAGGTTTAQGVLTALGHDATVSSSLPDNPLELKREAVREGLDASGLAPGDASGLEAAEDMGDPVLPAVAGIAGGADCPVLLAGGTQMGAAAALLRATGDTRDLAIGTTRWIVEDGSSDAEELAAETGSELLNSELSFETSRYPGLRAYEDGAVREGVGAGGLSLLAEQRFGAEPLLDEVEAVYESLVDT